MPELPEVETIRRQLAERLPGRTITEADAHPSDRFSSAHAVIGARLASVNRRGKYLLIATADHRELIVHLGMTGHLTLQANAPGAIGAPGTASSVRAWWAFDDASTLVLDDQRRFGRVGVTPQGDHRLFATLAQIGPEPLDDAFTPTRFCAALDRTRRPIKTTLLAQRAVAGIGNIYADEALWRAGINPIARSLSRPRATRLHGAIRDVLSEAIAHGGTRLRNYRTLDGDTGQHQFHLDCYGRAGQPCRRCATLFRRRVIDGRGTTWCPHCQPR